MVEHGPTGTTTRERPPSPDPAAQLPAEVERVLSDFLDDAADTLTALDPALAPLSTVAREAVLGGGKRVRPVFAYWGWRGVAGPGARVEPLLPALAALEILHAFALVHDDVMDGSDTRRGHPSAHRALAAGHLAGRLNGNADTFGRSTAILVGDLCLVWADQLLARSPLPVELLATARHSYDRMRVEAISGQFLDLLGDVSTDWSVDQALRTAQLKTASYTVVWPLQYGAALHPPPVPDWPATDVSRAYTRYGLAVGEAFQLRDDLLGVYGDPAATGKPVGDDLAGGKRTVLLELARSLAGDAQRRELETLLRSGDDPRRLATLVRETGAAARVDFMIEQRVIAAERALASAPIDPEARAALLALAAAAARRTT